MRKPRRWVLEAIRDQACRIWQKLPHLGIHGIGEWAKEIHIQLEEWREEMKRNLGLPWGTKKMAGGGDPSWRGWGGREQQGDRTSSLSGRRRENGKNTPSGGVKLHAKPVRPLGLAVRPVAGGQTAGTGGQTGYGLNWTDLAQIFREKIDLLYIAPSFHTIK